MGIWANWSSVYKTTHNPFTPATNEASTPLNSPPQRKRARATAQPKLQPAKTSHRAPKRISVSEQSKEPSSFADRINLLLKAAVKPSLPEL